MEQLSENFADNVSALDTLLGVGRNYDVVNRYLWIGGRRARLWVLDGYGEDAVLERMGAFWLGVLPDAASGITEMQDFVDRFVSFCEVTVSRDCRDIATAMLLGKTVLLVEGCTGAALIDAKKYPGRAVTEPAGGKVLRGSHDGFVETLLHNTALIRRRIRDPRLTMECHKIGDSSRTDVVLCYMENLVDPKLLAEVRAKVKGIRVNSLAMSQESVAEAMMARQWYNPYPKVRYTERPDAATACVMEGDIVLLVDNSPSVLLLPTTFFSFTQEANDFYFPPLVGSYLRILRILVFLLSLVITPLWYLLASHPELLPAALQFLAVKEAGGVPLLAQLLIVEFLIDLLKLASLNTPDALSNSFSMLGALILGDFAVQARWLVPEVLVYMAFVSIATFAQPSFELGYAFKLQRVALLLLISVLEWWGFGLGLLGMLLLLATTKPIAGRGYLYPLVPFDG
ncbi:MAG: spore germination protein, partial [Oscillospiraceae bacterium]